MIIVETTGQLRAMVQLLRQSQNRSQYVTFDTEATSERPEDAELVGVSFSDGIYGWYVPVGHEEGPQVDLEIVLDSVAPVLKHGIVTHGGKYDLRLMRKYKTEVNLTLDTLSAVRLLGEVDYGVGLKEVVERWYGYSMLTFKELLKQTGAKNAAQVPIEDMAPYAIDDAVQTYHVAKDAMAKLKPYARVLLDYEVKAMVIASLMEDTGLPVDLAMLKDAIEEGKRITEELRQDAIAALQAINPEVPDDLNLRSAPQLQHTLFELCGFPVVERSPKTKKPSANKQVLAKLALEHSEVGIIASYRSAATTVNRLKELVKYARGREGHNYVHASLNPAGTATGRWSSSEPNIQNHPRTPYFYGSSQSVWQVSVRDAILAPPGYIIVSADYGQMELRVAAGFSQEKAWLDAFTNNADVHTATAAAIFNKKPSEVTEDERYKGKTLNFSMLFGATDSKVSQLLGVTRDEAATIINAFWRGLPGVTEWVETVHTQAMKKGYVTTAFGRRRWLWVSDNKQSYRLIDYPGKKEWVIAAALRESVNTIIQGTAADLLKVGLSAQHPQALAFGAKLFLVVHDQFVWLVPEAVPLSVFARTMEPLICPQMAGFPEIVADWGIGRRLGTLEKYSDAAKIPEGLTLPAA